MFKQEPSLSLTLSHSLVACALTCGPALIHKAVGCGVLRVGANDCPLAASGPMFGLTLATACGICGVEARALLHAMRQHEFALLAPALRCWPLYCVPQAIESFGAGVGHKMVDSFAAW